jgi:glycosyltransferase involved in cell wall biosynthesis
MPTRNRRAFVPLAVERFLRQDYPERELLVLDDGEDAVADLIPDDPRIRYERLARPAPLGATRNLGCRLAEGELVAHWDDDDWSAPWRVSYQVDELRKSGAQICGLRELYFYEPAADRAWRYTYPAAGVRSWVAGGTMCYRKDFWSRHPFPEIASGEDTRFLWTGRPRIHAADDSTFYVAIIHPGNTSPKRTRGSRWKAVDAEVVRRLDADNLTAYDARRERMQPATPSSGRITAPPADVTIGVQVHADPDRLKATLASVARTAPWAEVVLLPDGPDAATAAAVERLGLPSLATSEPRGAAACLNRLTARGAETSVLLESGSILAPDAMERLVRALRQEPSAGLAGPSTNAAWNEQRAFPAAREADVNAVADEARRRFGGSVRTLEPLHSLADFCYAVTRALVDAIGSADEGYGLGPGWEMDYNIRAARAGYRGLWVCAAYVHRGPLTGRRVEAEGRLADASRRRYQDRFCGLRLAGAATDYEPHCRGDSCEHFAPAGLIRIREDSAEGAAARPAQRAPQPRPQRRPPLVSCIMPTGDRAELALQAVTYFLRQDYPARELVIVDDGSDGLERLLPADERIVHIRVPRGLSIGAKRNRACETARGDVLVHWDDDDWYGATRLRTQAEPLLAGAADITGLVCTALLELQEWRFWQWTPALHRRMFIENVVGGTLAYRREVWARLARYPDRSLAEDGFMLRQAVKRGARLHRISGEGLFVYVRHGANTWRFVAGRESEGWLPIAEPPLPFEDRAFYASRSPSSSGTDGSALVSCIMPTADRRSLAGLAIQYFLRQDYANRELIILDDGQDRIGDLVPRDPRVRYVPHDGGLLLGAKRNLACELARGSLIAHWDDDDWQAPHRLSYQVAELERHDADVCGANRVLYLDWTGQRAWRYEWPAGGRRWLAGNGLCYRKALWERIPFAPVATGEDARFVWATRASRMATLADEGFLVGLVHPRNTSPKDVSGSHWHACPLDELRRLLGNDFDAHLAGTAGGP